MAERSQPSDYMTCRHCRKDFRAITVRHLRNIHGYDDDHPINEYKRKFHLHSAMCLKVRKRISETLEDRSVAGSALLLAGVVPSGLGSDFVTAEANGVGPLAELSILQGAIADESFSTFPPSLQFPVSATNSASPAIGGAKTPSVNWNDAEADDLTWSGDAGAFKFRTGSSGALPIVNESAGSFSSGAPSGSPAAAPAPGLGDDSEDLTALMSFASMSRGQNAAPLVRGGPAFAPAKTPANLASTFGPTSSPKSEPGSKEPGLSISSGTNSGMLVVGPDAGAQPRVKVFDAATGQERFSFLAYSGSFRGGVRVAVGDVSGDGTPDIITGTGLGGGNIVKVFDGRNGNQLA